jgi:hypothetical protein
MVPILLITGGIACQIKPQINPQIISKEEPSLERYWFTTESVPLMKAYDARGATIDGEIWTCFSPKDSRALAEELLTYREKLIIMNTRMEVLYKRYFGEVLK